MVQCRYFVSNLHISGDASAVYLRLLQKMRSIFANAKRSLQGRYGYFGISGNFRRLGHVYLRV
jgi:hypothetical protein